jgi:hypothetical protein
VWAFGVLLWELLTCCRDFPYEEFNDDIDLANRIENGLRLPQPPRATEGLYDLMLKCWRIEPDDRPRFRDILDSIPPMIKHMLSTPSFLKPPPAFTSPPPKANDRSAYSRLDGNRLKLAGQSYTQVHVSQLKLTQSASTVQPTGALPPELPVRRPTNPLGQSAASGIAMRARTNTAALTEASIEEEEDVLQENKHIPRSAGLSMVLCSFPSVVLPVSVKSGCVLADIFHCFHVLIVTASAVKYSMPDKLSRRSSNTQSGSFEPEAQLVRQTSSSSDTGGGMCAVPKVIWALCVLSTFSCSC